MNSTFWGFGVLGFWGFGAPAQLQVRLHEAVEWAAPAEAFRMPSAREMMTAEELAELEEEIEFRRAPEFDRPGAGDTTNSRQHHRVSEGAGRLTQGPATVGGRPSARRWHTGAAIADLRGRGGADLGGAGDAHSRRRRRSGRDCCWEPRGRRRTGR